jgi:ParB family transcriptional regulator, chromosome partitioning protein
MAKSKAVENELLMLDPGVILADDNTRFGLKPTRIESLAKSIVERGGVLEPVEIELLSAADSNGHQYRLTTGFYRLAAVNYLNTTQAAGLTIPAIVRPMPTPQERLRRQLAENMERENQSPMDTAIAIQRLLAAGLSRIEVREIFSRPGGRKGNKLQPASNSFLNIHLNMLDLPKGIQTKIHEGLVGTAAAMELTKVPAEKRSAVLEAAESSRQRDLEREERDEEKLLAQEKRIAEDRKKRDDLAAESTKASELAATTLATFNAAVTTTSQLHTASIGKHPDAATKKAARKAFVDSEKQRLVAEADNVAAQEKAEAAQKKLTEYDTRVATKAAALKAAKATAPTGATKKGDAVGPQDVKKAAKAAGATTNNVPLGKAEIVKVVAALSLAGGNPTVIAIGAALTKCFAGETTEQQLYAELVKIVS